MGCGSSRLGTSGKVPETLRRHLESIRRRRRVADAFINAKETTNSLSIKKLLLETDSDKVDSSPNSSRDLDNEKMSTVFSGDQEPAGSVVTSMPLEREREDRIVEAVRRAIDDIKLEEELADNKSSVDDGEDDDDDDAQRVVARKKDDEGEQVCFGSPSFRVYCVGLKPFGSFASLQEDYEAKIIEDEVPNVKNESRNSSVSQPSPVQDKEGSVGSSKSNRQGRNDGGTKKVPSYWRKKGPLGMKMLLHLCYSCAVHDRARTVVPN